MSFKDKSFKDRLSDSAAKKQELLQRFKTAPKLDDAELARRRQEAEEAAALKAQRAAEKKVAQEIEDRRRAGGCLAR
jgi:Family of unknown function (DUF6481)